MECPLCGGSLAAIDTKNRDGWIHRKRECHDCLTRYSTEERLTYNDLDPYILGKLKSMKKSVKL